MAGSLLAGAARVPITGTGRYGLAGPYRRRATGIHDDVFARCLAVCQDNRTVVLLTLDASGLPPPAIGALRAEVRRRVTAHQLRLLVAGTAVLSAPDLLREGRGCSEAYRRFLADELAEVVVRAVETLEPASLTTAAASMPRDLLVSEDEQQIPPIVIFSLTGAGRRPIGTVAVIGCRPDVLGPANTQISADYLYAYHTAIEGARGGLSLMLPGAVGDESARDPRAPQASRTFDAAKAVGEAIATPVLHALASGQQVAEPRLEMDTCRADLRLAYTWSARHAWWRSLRLGAPGRVRAELHNVRIGDCQLLTVPGAPTRAAAIQIRGRITTRLAALVACTEGMWGPLRPPEVPDNGLGEGWRQLLGPAAWPVLRDTLPVY